MINISLLSAWSIFVALAGVSLNAFFTTPYTKVAYLASETKMKHHKIKESKIGISFFHLPQNPRHFPQFLPADVPE